MRTLWLKGLLVTTALAAAVSACSFLVDTDATQCTTDGDCAKFVKEGGGAVCQASVCVKTDGFANCFAGVPTTNDQLMNACNGNGTTCLPFDNCAKLGLCENTDLLGTTDPTPPASSSSGAPEDAGGIPRCKDLVAAAGVRPIYASGSSNFPPFVSAITPLLARNDPAYGMVWQTSSSCDGVNAAFNPDVAKRRLKQTAINTWFYSLGDDGKATRTVCVIDDDQEVDFGESDIYATTCEERLGYRPENPTGTPIIGEYLGPIQAMTIAVPQGSTQTAISAEAAQSVFGKGAPPTGALPWNNEQQIFNRSDSTATNQLISRAIFVPPKKWHGQSKSTATDMANALKNVPAEAVEQTIGIVGTDGADSNRGNIKVLAFQARGQGCGFWPDSTPFATDKRNVRDGHYTMWGPLHFYARLVNGQPNDAASAFVLRFSVPKLDEDLLRSVAATANVPRCAMKVDRESEMGAMTPYEPNFGCGCFYESVVTNAEPPNCRKCSGTQDCPQEAPACNYGYCEKK